MLGKYITNVRNESPLIHNITNYVTVHDVANIILAIGGSPIMADGAEEMEDIQQVASALNINIGTLNERTIESMFVACKKANELSNPIVFDMVGAGASKLRKRTVEKLLKTAKFTVIKGNLSEIKTIALGSGITKGVDAEDNDYICEKNINEYINLAKDFARKTGAIIVITGGIDIVADDTVAYAIYNGRPEMSKITGTGCQLSGLISCFVSANEQSKLDAVASAVCSMGVAGERAFANLENFEGNATYSNRIIDEMYNMNSNILDMEAKYEIR